MNLKLKTALAASAMLLATHAAAQITFYEGEGFRGRIFTANNQVNNFQRVGFNDQIGRASCRDRVLMPV